MEKHDTQAEYLKQMRVCMSTSYINTYVNEGNFEDGDKLRIKTL